MAFYAGVIAREPAMENPTIVVLTDRNDLDDQLFGTFARCQDLLGQPPAQAESRADLRKQALGRLGRRRVHHDPEVLPRRAGRHAPLAVPSGATLSSSPTRRTAASTTSSTASRGTCATRCRTPRSSASRARPSSCGTRTRAPSSATTSASTTSSRQCSTAPPSPSTTRTASPSSPSTRTCTCAHRRRVRGGDRRRGGRAQGAAQDALGAARGHRRRRAARPPRRRRHRRALRAAPRCHRGQSDGGLHEPPHLHRPVPRARTAAPRLGARSTTTGARSRS